MTLTGSWEQVRLKENQRRERGEREEKEIICEGCFRVFCGSNVCPSCGAVTSIRSAYTDYIDGQLGLGVESN